LTTNAGISNNLNMVVEYSDLDFGVLVNVKERVDAFNFDEAKARFTQAYELGRKFMAIDLTQAPFLSLQSIKFIHSLAVELEGRGGRLALIGPGQKIKRQIDIFASLDPIDIWPDQSQWQQHLPLNS